MHAICEAIDAERVRAAKLSASASGSAGAGPAMLLEELGCAKRLASVEREAGAAHLLRLGVAGSVEE